MTDISGSPSVSVRSVLQRALDYLNETPKESWCAIVRDAKIALARSPAEDAIESHEMCNLRSEVNLMRAEAARRQQTIEECLKQIARVAGDHVVRVADGDLLKLVTELVNNVRSLEIANGRASQYHAEIERLQRELGKSIKKIDDLQFQVATYRNESWHLQSRERDAIRLVGMALGDKATESKDLVSIVREVVNRLARATRYSFSFDPAVCSSKKEAEAALRARELELRIEHLKEDRERARRERDEAREALADARARYRRHIGSD